MPGSNSRYSPTEPDENEILRAFRACPKTPKADFEAILPDMMDAATLLADTQGVGWEWGLLALLVTASSCAPQDRFESAPSIPISSALWTCLIHPGATNSSGIIRVVTSALELMYDWLYDHECEEARRTAEDPGSVTLPPRRQVLAGGGSLAAVGLQMSLEQNRGAAVSIEPEIEQILHWFTSEMGIDRGAAGKLWDNAVWSRPVMDKTRAFIVKSAWYAFLAGGHVPELFRAMVDDTFGLRQRLTVCFCEPPWEKMCISDIRAACDRLPVPAKKPEMFIASLLFPLLVSSIAKPEGSLITAQGEALELVDANFNDHKAMQEDAFLKPDRHNEAKHHGKLRTKFQRMMLSTHLLNACCTRWKQATAELPPKWNPQEPAFQVPASFTAPEVKFAFAFADKCERTWEIMDFARKGHTLPDDVPNPSDLTQPPLPLPPVLEVSDLSQLANTLRGDSGAIREEDLQKFLRPQGREVMAVALVGKLPVRNISVRILVNMVKCILQTPGCWVYWTKSVAVKKSFKRITHGVCSDLTQSAAFYAGMIMDALGLAKVVRSAHTAGGGRPAWFMAKKPPCETARQVLALFGIGEETVPSIQTYTQSIASDTDVPPRAPPVAWGDIVVPAYGSDTTLAILRGLGLLALPNLPAEPPAAPAALDEDAAMFDDAELPLPIQAPAAVVAEFPANAEDLVNAGFGM
jgi:hypothetical protein